MVNAEHRKRKGLLTVELIAAIALLTVSAILFSRYKIHSARSLKSLQHLIQANQFITSKAEEIRTWDFDRIHEDTIKDEFNEVAVLKGRSHQLICTVSDDRKLSRERVFG